jgi:hypothetical protein
MRYRLAILRSTRTANAPTRSARCDNSRLNILAHPLASGIPLLPLTQLKRFEWTAATESADVSVAVLLTAILFQSCSPARPS